MTTKSKPEQVALTGQSTQTPDKPLVKLGEEKLGEEMDDAALDGVSGGMNFAQITMKPVIEQIRLPAGIGSFHPGAWST